jgi:alkylated DNA repair dioxygenase AlkB
MSEQGLLFADLSLHRQTPAGFSLCCDYINRDEEQVLLECVDRGPWETDWRRRIQQFGLGYSDSGGEPVWLRDFPDWLKPLAGRVGQKARFDRYPENCVINEYIPPQGIGPHKDYAAFGPTIACVSLGSDVLLDFISADRSSRMSVDIPARSLWVITGEARSRWMHGIARRFNDIVDGARRKRDRRISITFRTAKDPASVPPAQREQIR